ncbi:hypothetical protein [Legionella genomosp. 1]|uniref:hypothetical protein n=1 Tax=Legionella genomosp. 1 TaxID=1093625 RepID=UPI0010562ECD|nr:hypothetical protein [Legionella genomosp. 1]
MPPLSPISEFIKSPEMNPVPSSFPKTLAMEALQYVKSLPTHAPESEEAKLSEEQIETILNGNGSTLDKIKASYIAMKQTGACNSKHQALCAFQFILNRLITSRVADINKTMPLELLSLLKHFIVIINDEVICDPALEACYLASDLPTLISRDHKADWGMFHDPSTYFKIEKNWLCYSCLNPNNTSSLDRASMESIYNLFPQVYSDSPLTKSVPQKAEDAPDIVVPKR